jgi:hypothetical protein
MDSDSPTVARNRLAVALFYASIACYLISFFLPAFADSSPAQALEGEGGSGRVYTNHSGFDAFVMSVLAAGIAGPLPLVIWFANPLAICSVVALRCRYRAAAITCGSGAVILASILLTDGLELLRIGYFIWLGSMLLLTAAAFCSEDGETVD